MPLARARNNAPHAAEPPADREPYDQQRQTGFFSGLQLLFRDRYLLGIFVVVSVYEIIVTIFDFNFKRLAFAAATGDQATASLLGNYGSMVNCVSFLCLACGISNVQRRLGMRVALCAMPFVIGVMVLAFDMAPTLSVLFWIMVGGKAINYALNSPCLKQLYIPTSLDAKYKSQAWIEMFGARGAKAGGSGLNTLLKVFQAGAASPAAGHRDVRPVRQRFFGRAAGRVVLRRLVPRRRIRPPRCHIALEIHPESRDPGLAFITLFCYRKAFEIDTEVLQRIRCLLHRSDFRPHLTPFNAYQITCRRTPTSLSGPGQMTPADCLSRPRYLQQALVDQPTSVDMWVAWVSEAYP